MAIVWAWDDMNARHKRRTGWNEAHKTGCFAQRAERGLDLTEWSVSVAFSPRVVAKRKFFCKKKLEKKIKKKK